MRTKIYLPALAMIFAIGMSFASVKPDEVQEYDYLHLGGDSWQQIDEVPCVNGVEICQVQYGENGTPQDVFDEMSLNSRKSSNTKKPFILNP